MMVMASLGLTDMDALTSTKMAGQIIIQSIDSAMFSLIIGNKPLIQMVIHTEIIMAQIVVILGMIQMLE